MFLASFPYFLAHGNSHIPCMKSLQNISFQIASKLLLKLVQINTKINTDMPETAESQSNTIEVPHKVGEQLSFTSKIRARGRPAVEIHPDAAKKPILGRPRSLGFVTNEKWNPAIKASFIPSPTKESAETAPRKRMTAKQKFFALHEEFDQSKPEGKKAWKEEIFKKDSIDQAAWLGKGGAGETTQAEEVEKLWAEHKADLKEKRSKTRRKNSAIKAAILGDVPEEKDKKVSPSPESGVVLLALDKVAGIEVPRILSREKNVPVAVQLRQTDDGTKVNVQIGRARTSEGRQGKVSVDFNLPTVIIPALVEEGERVIKSKEKKDRTFVLPVIGRPDFSKVNFDKRLLIPATLIPLICLAGLLASSGRGGEVPTFPTLSVTPVPIEALVPSTGFALPTPEILAHQVNPTTPITETQPVIIVSSVPTNTVPSEDGRPPRTRQTPVQQQLPAGIACGSQEVGPHGGPETFSPPADWQPNQEALGSIYQHKADFQNAVYDIVCQKGINDSINPDGTLNVDAVKDILPPEYIKTWDGNVPFLDRYDYVDPETGQRDMRGDSFSPKPSIKVFIQNRQKDRKNSKLNL